jgi:hypothetical protein
VIAPTAVVVRSRSAVRQSESDYLASCETEALPRVHERHGPGRRGEAVARVITSAFM